MQKTKKVLKPVPVIEEFICDCCEKAVRPNSDDLDETIETHEMLHIRMDAGFGSIFGEGTKVEGDFCQACVNKLLGKFLRYSRS